MTDAGPHDDAAESATDESLTTAARTIRDGGTVVYPTETVYGLGADALDPEAVERVFDLKGRSRDDPVSLAVPDVATATDYTRPTPRERGFMRAFLPGPVTVVVERGPDVPDVLTAGSDRVGVRVPVHPVALALLDRVHPVTATSANRSGQGSARRVRAVDAGIRAASVVLDGGETPGTESTVVDVDRGVVHRRGALADEIEAWLRD